MLVKAEGDQRARLEAINAQLSRAIDDEIGGLNLNKPFHPRLALLLVCLGIVLVVAAACVPVPTPAPATVTPSNAITNIVWQWTSVTNQPTEANDRGPQPAGLHHHLPATTAR